ncbi:trypsin-like peptidase domain-containing protein [Streptomyces sp. NPDC101219]|uniref:S1C family serine protease n=1 Tax=Streptomyces sp. NPDC101219 TaxID=3366131 RepID=UPI0037F407BC
MNEGKPGPPGERAETSADVAPTETTGARETDRAPDGGGTPPGGPRESRTGARDTVDAAPRGADGGAPAPVADGDTDGDFELARPAAPATDADGDYALSGPLSPGPEQTVPTRGTEPHPAPGAGTGTVGGRDGTSHAPAVPAPSGEPAGPAAADVSSEGPRPLHDPDPYSTPPYGEPGPWAPAPPVQHPATASAQAVPPHDAPPAGPPQAATPAYSPPHGATGPGVPAPGALLDAPPAGPPHGATPPQGVPASGVPAPGVPSPGAPLHDVPAPGVPPHEAAVPPPAPVPDAPQAAAPGMPAPGMPAPGVPAPGVPAHPGSGQEAAPPAPGADPWGRYDPWAASAASAPLQVSGPAEDTERGRRKLRARIILVAVIVFGLLCGVVGGLVGAYLERNGGVGGVELPQTGKEAADRDPDSVAGIASRALPSVVTLHASGTSEAGTGTGFVLDTRGHILTNNHVVEPAGGGGEITVTFHSGDTAEATVIGRDSGYDLAVVKVKGVSGLTPLPLGNSDNVRVGDPVVAIGAPFDLAGTVTSGIISARERPITAGGQKGDGSDVSYVDALQTDAPINPGNSGGPLLDAKARVIGINSAIRSAGSGSELDGGQAGSIGLGFAIPINQGKRVAEELIDTGKATHPVIGITLDMEFSGDGARVGAKGTDGGPPVVTDGPGDKAGIEAGDVITEVNGQRVHSGEELIVKTRAHRPGDRLELTLERDGEERTVSLVLGSSDGR